MRCCPSPHYQRQAGGSLLGSNDEKNDEKNEEELELVKKILDEDAIERKKNVLNPKRPVHSKEWVIYFWSCCCLARMIAAQPWSLCLSVCLSE